VLKKNENESFAQESHLPFEVVVVFTPQNQRFRLNLYLLLLNLLHQLSFFFETITKSCSVVTEHRLNNLWVCPLFLVFMNFVNSKGLRYCTGKSLCCPTEIILAEELLRKNRQLNEKAER
jgi:hypothetical protein